MNRTTVAILGAGPAGLTLGNLLIAEGIACVILERRSRSYVEARARAGYLCANSVRILCGNGLAAALETSGQRHGTCAFRSAAASFTLDYGQLTAGEMHTVYPQQYLVRDLIAEFQARGGDVRFDLEVLRVEGVDTGRPTVTARDGLGEEHEWSGEFVAGCDGRHGVSRQAIPSGSVRSHRRDHGVSWLAVLAQAPPSMPSVTYAVHADGFAGHMARTADVTRYYLQCDPADRPGDWSPERIWAGLHKRFTNTGDEELIVGDLLERSVVEMASDVMVRFQFGRLFLVGDAASLISASAAKGANLAIMEAEVLARALARWHRAGDQEPLAGYSDDCLPRVWRAQEFSHWMLETLNAPPAGAVDADFRRELQQARLRNLQTSSSAQRQFAEQYVSV